MGTLEQERARAIARQRQAAARVRVQPSAETDRGGPLLGGGPQDQPFILSQPAPAVDPFPMGQDAVQIDGTYYAPGTTPEMAADIPPGMSYDPRSGRYVDVAQMTDAQPMGRGEAAALTFTQGANWGGADEIGGAAVGTMDGAAQGQFTRQAMDARIDRARRDFPMTSIPAEIGGAVAGTVSPANLARTAATRLSGPVAGVASALLNPATRGQQIVSAVTTGATGGAVYGSLDAEPGQRAEGAAIGAGLGALFGAVAPDAARALSALPRGVASMFQRSIQRPTVEALRDVKNAAYRLVDQSGETFTPQEMAGLSQTVRAAFENGNYVEEVDNASRAVISILERRAATPTTLSQLDGIRQNLWSRYSTNRDQPQILDAIHAIDQLVESRAGADALMETARAANARYAKSQLLHDAFERATDQTAGTGSGGNIGNKFRQAITSIINDPSRTRFFSADEVRVMREFVRGSRGQDYARLIGKLSPSGNGLMAALQITGGVISQGATIPLMLAGAGSKAMYDNAINRGAQGIMDMVAGARPIPQAATRMAPNALALPLAAGTAPLVGQQVEPARNALRLLQ